MGKQVENLIKIQRKNCKYIKFEVPYPAHTLSNRYTVPWQLNSNVQGLHELEYVPQVALAVYKKHIKNY